MVESKTPVRSPEHLFHTETRFLASCRSPELSKMASRQARLMPQLRLGRVQSLVQGRTLVAGVFRSHACCMSHCLVDHVPRHANLLHNSSSSSSQCTEPAVFGPHKFPSSLNNVSKLLLPHWSKMDFTSTGFETREVRL